MECFQTNQLNCEYEGRVGWDETAKPTSTYRNKMVRILRLLLHRDIPYANSGGMVRVRFSLRHMPRSPWSQPLITCPKPTLKMKISKAFQLSQFRYFLRVTARGWPRSKLDIDSKVSGSSALK